MIGRGSCVDNDVRVGARVKVQTNVYLTAYSVVEDDVFVGPGVCTTNDDTMSRHDRDYELRGAVLRRACRVGGGAVLTPGVEIGEEAFVAAGAVVTKDVPPRAVVMGVPARVVREVADAGPARALALEVRASSSRVRALNRRVLILHRERGRRRDVRRPPTGSMPPQRWRRLLRLRREWYRSPQGSPRSGTETGTTSPTTTARRSGCTSTVTRSAPERPTAEDLVRAALRRRCDRRLSAGPAA